MLSFKLFLLESVKRAESSANVNARGFVSEYAIKHSVDLYHHQRQQGQDHDTALAHVARNQQQVKKLTASTPEVQKVSGILSSTEFEQTIKDSHDHALHLIHYLHQNEGGITGPAIATGGMQSQTINAHYGQETAADLLIPVVNGPHTHVGVSLKYSSSSRPSIIKMNTPGAGVMHQHLQNLHHAIFGSQNTQLQQSWDNFLPKLKGEVADPKSIELIRHLKTLHKEKFPTQPNPPARRVLRKAGEGIYGDAYKFNTKKPQEIATTPTGEQVRQVYNQAYSVKADKDFIEYSSLAQQHLQKIFDHVAKTKNPQHIQAIHDFVHKMTNTIPNEPRIKTLLFSITRNGKPSDPIATGSTINKKLQQANGHFSASQSKHSITIDTGGTKITWGRSDPARGNPINIQPSHLKGTD